MTKTAQQWIEQSTLPAEVKEAALAMPHNEGQIDSLTQAILFGFLWPTGEDAANYWRSVLQHIELGNDPATCPLPPLRLPVIPWEFVAPKYNYHGFDSDGYGGFHEKEPTPYMGENPHWLADVCFNADSGLYLKTPRWKETLQQRPTKTQ